MCKHPARFIHALTALAVLAVTASAFAADRPPRDQPGRLFRIVNATFDSVTALEIADDSTRGFQPIHLGEPLQGGLTSTTVRLPDGACLRDVRATFRDGRSEVYRAIDVCKATGFRLAAHGLPAAH